MSHPVNYKNLFSAEWDIVHSVDKRRNKTIVKVVHKKTGVVFDHSEYDNEEPPFDGGGR